MSLCPSPGGNYWTAPLCGTCLNLVAYNVAVGDTDGETDKYLIGYVGLWLASHQAPGSSLCLGGSGIASRAPIRAMTQEIQDLGSELTDRGCPKWLDAGRLRLVSGSRYKVRSYGPWGKTPMYTTRRGSRSCTGEYNTNSMLAEEVELQLEAWIYRMRSRTRVARAIYSTWAVISGLVPLMGVVGARNNHVFIDLCDCRADLNGNLVGNVIVDIDSVEIKKPHSPSLPWYLPRLRIGALSTSVVVMILEPVPLA